MSDLEATIRAIVRDELAKAAREPAPVEHLSVTAYARRWSIAESTVRAAIREGRLAHERVGRTGRAVRIPADAKIQKVQRGAEDAWNERSAKVLRLARGGGVR